MISKNSIAKAAGYQNFVLSPFPVVLSVGDDRLIDFVNDAAFPLFKRELDIKGRSLVEMLPEIFTDNTIAELRRENKSGGSLVIRQKQIMYFVQDRLAVSWYDVVNTPLYDDDGAVTGTISYFSDVSDKVVSRKSIEQREEYLTNFFRQAPIGLVCYRGPEFIVDLANDKALEMWGRTWEEVKGKPIHEIFPEVLTDPAISKRHRESQERLKRGETHVVNEVELTFMRDGRPRQGWYSYIHEPYTNGVGEIIGMMAIAIEVTDQVVARKKLQLVTDALPSLISYINQNEEYDFVNKAYETWFGRSRTEVVGKTIEQVLGPAAYAKVKHHVDTALSGKVDSFENWINYSDGRRRFVSASYIPHFGNGNQVLGYVGLVNDLTERKTYEEALIENEARLRLLIEGIGAGTFDYDLKTGNINWSPELKALLGLPKDCAIDPDVARSVLHPDDLSTVLQVTERLHSGRGSAGYIAVDYRIIRKDNGETRWIHSRFRPLPQEEGGSEVPTRIIGFSIDITDQKRSEAKLREFNQTLERTVEERTAELRDLNELLTERNTELNKAHAVLQQLIDSSPELIVVVDRALRFLAVNKPFEDFAGKSRSELIGSEIYEAYGGSRGSTQVALLESALRGERIHLKTNPSISRPNVWFDTHYVPLVIQGKIEGAIVLSRDITDIIKSERELANVNRQLQDAQHLSKLGSWEWDISTGTVYWSDEMYRIYGYDERFPVDFVKATERMSPQDAEGSSKRTQQHIQHALEAFKNTGAKMHEIPAIEFPIQLPGGERKLLRNTGKIQLTDEGKVYRILGAVQDITQIRSTESRLRQLIEELKAKNNELESFNYVASHDLKEPLRKIQTYIDRMRANRNGNNESYLGKINDAAKRMADLIGSILSLGQVSNGEMERVDVDLNRVLELCKSDLEVSIRETKAGISADKLPVVKASELQMIQVFSNLLANSIKFCETAPVIRVSCVKVPARDFKNDILAREDYWKISFTDNGIGFDPRFKQQVFEPFQRLHHKGEYAGTGIGLSIVKKIIERHDGVIEVESEKGKGTTFALYLPVI